MPSTAEPSETSGPRAAPKSSSQAQSRAIARQIVLPFRKSLEISFNSLRLRFFRSMITVSSLVLAVAFLCFVLVSADLANGMLARGGPEMEQRLLAAGYDIVDGVVGAGAKERWIVFLSLLVCAVGIFNAQLMAVTERFREIGVMKCLGALDRFVLRLFLLEAGMQGLAGAGLGAVLGLLTALVVGLLRFGFTALTSLSFADLGASMLWSLGAGFGLSLLGVFYPAVVAARMRPVLALSAEH